MVELPEARFTFAALSTILPFSVAVIDPLLVIVPVAFKVKVVPEEVPEAVSYTHLTLPTKRIV